MGQHKRTAVNKWGAQCSRTLMPEKHRKRRGEGGKWRTGSTEDFKRQSGHSLVTLWKPSCDTLETLLWHFGNTLVTLWILSCDILYSVGPFTCQLLLHYSRFPSIRTDCCSGMLFREFQVLTLQLQILLAIKWQVRLTNLPTEELWTKFAYMMIIIPCTNNDVYIYDDYYSLHQRLR